MDSVIVVGAGCFGASLAWTLARQGIAVTLIDQFEPGDPRATSGGETRLIRCSHGAATEYTAMARRARTLWRELEAESGADLLVECGVAWFAHREDGWEAHSERTLTEQGIPVERVDGATLFPSFAGDDLLFTLFEPEAGVLRAAHGVRALAAQAREHGAHLVQGRARPEGNAVVMEDGRRYEAGAVVWACGGWLAGLFPGLVSLRVTRQDLLFFDGGPAWQSAPGWVDYDLAMYGTGDIDGLGVKLAPDAEGPELSPDADLPATDPASEQAAREYAALRFPALAQARLAGSKTCRYELTADSQLVAGPHPAQPGVWLMGGGSGHGYKHGPALAERMAAAIRGEGEMPGAWCAGERVPGSSLRTAGSGGL
jgi:glycine/D-amino acid oxidase-like deaminating enzyme